MKKFIWTNKRHADYLENGILKYLHRERLRIIKSKVLNNHSEIKRFLDLGCGDGIFIKSLSDIDNISFIGCDADYNRMLRARECCPKKSHFINSLAEETPFRDNTFDLVLLHHVLEHVKDDKALLNECVRILKPNRIFILGIPNENSLNGRISRFLHTVLYKKGEHINFYSEPQIISLLSLFPFKILSISRIGFLFPEYYFHMLLISNRITFKLGNLITKILKFSADSLIIVSKSIKK